MKFKSLLSLSFLFYFHTLSLFSQTYIGPRIGLKHGDLQEDAAIDFFDSELGYAIGIQVKKETQNRFYYTAAFSIERAAWVRTIDNNVYLKEIHLKGNAFSLSADIGFYLLNAKNFHIGIATGLKFGKVFNSEFDYYPKLPNTILLGPLTTIYGSFDTRLDLCIQMSNLCTLNISPNYSFLLSENVRNRIWRNPGVSVSFLFQVSN